jgi:hypothetical protein
MSPFYVLSQKQCYPDGCVYFKWTCRLLAKKKTCFRGFSYVGKKCFNCKYFYEEKQHQYPELINPHNDNDTFVEEFSEFEEWINYLQLKRTLCEGTISGINPDMTLKQNGTRKGLSVHGFLARFEDGYIDNQLFEDPFYLSISSMSQNKLLLRKGDNIEFEASLIIDRGRLKFVKPGRFQFYNRGNEKPLRRNDVLVALETYTIQEKQHAKCMNCVFGILVDVVNTKNGPSRSTVCLQGITDPQYCTITIQTKDSKNSDSCVNSSWKGKKCHHVL